MSIDGISVCVYTGLGISDVSTFHINRLLESGKCHIRTTKNGKKVYRWTPIWLQQRIRERAKFYGPLISDRTRQPIGGDKRGAVTPQGQ